MHVAELERRYHDLQHAAKGNPSGQQRKSEDQILKLQGARAETYKSIDGIDLSLYIFEPDGHKASDRRPAAVFFFGGGWNGGTPQQFEPHCRYLASRGMVAIVADYRVKSRHGTSPFECVKDGKSAIRWIRSHAERLGIDPARIAAGGGSAGGHVAAAAGNLPKLEEDGEDLTVSSVPKRVAAFQSSVRQRTGGIRVRPRGRALS